MRDVLLLSRFADALRLVYFVQAVSSVASCSRRLNEPIKSSSGTPNTGTVPSPPANGEIAQHVPQAEKGSDSQARSTMRSVARSKPTRDGDEAPKQHQPTAHREHSNRSDESVSGGNVMAMDEKAVAALTDRRYHDTESRLEPKLRSKLHETEEVADLPSGTAGASWDQSGPWTYAATASESTHAPDPGDSIKQVSRLLWKRL